MGQYDGLLAWAQEGDLPTDQGAAGSNYWYANDSDDTRGIAGGGDRLWAVAPNGRGALFKATIDPTDPYLDQIQWTEVPWPEFGWPGRTTDQSSGGVGKGANERFLCVAGGSYSYQTSDIYGTVTWRTQSMNRVVVVDGETDANRQVYFPDGTGGRIFPSVVWISATRVLIFGGYAGQDEGTPDGNSIYNTAIIYDWATNTFITGAAANAIVPPLDPAWGTPSAPSPRVGMARAAMCCDGRWLWHIETGETGSAGQPNRYGRVHRLDLGNPAAGWQLVTQLPTFMRYDSYNGGAYVPAYDWSQLVAQALPDGGFYVIGYGAQGAPSPCAAYTPGIGWDAAIEDRRLLNASYPLSMAQAGGRLWVPVSDGTTDVENADGQLFAAAVPSPIQWWTGSTRRNVRLRGHVAAVDAEGRATVGRARLRGWWDGAEVRPIG